MRLGRSGKPNQFRMQTRRRRHFCPAGKPFKAEVVENQDLHWRESKPFFPVGMKCMVNKNKVRILGKGSWRR